MPIKRQPKPKPYTDDEVIDNFLVAVCHMVDYWETVPNPAHSRNSRVSGIAFSILAMLDGSNMGIPKFKVIPDPHPDDKDFQIKEGERWYRPASMGNDISGGLHELFHTVRRRLKNAGKP